jgi:hypothetical protein
MKLAMSMWLMKRRDEKFLFKGHVVKRRGDERNFGGHRNKEKR